MQLPRRFHSTQFWALPANVKHAFPAITRFKKLLVIRLSWLSWSQFLYSDFCVREFKKRLPVDWQGLFEVNAAYSSAIFKLESGLITRLSFVYTCRSGHRGDERCRKRNLWYWRSLVGYSWVWPVSFVQVHSLNDTCTNELGRKCKRCSFLENAVSWCLQTAFKEFLSSEREIYTS